MTILFRAIQTALINPPLQWLLGVLLFSYGMEKRPHWRTAYAISFLGQTIILSLAVLRHIQTGSTFLLGSFPSTMFFMTLNFLTLYAMGQCSIREVLLRLIGVQALQNILWSLYNCTFALMGWEYDAGLRIELLLVLLIVLYVGCFALCRNELRQEMDPHNLPVLVVSVLALYVKDFLGDTPYSDVSDILIDLLAFCIMFDFFKERKLTGQVRAMEQILANEHKQHELVKEEIDIINRKCHDLKHQLMLLDTENGTLSEFKEEAERALRIYDSTIKTGNEVLDVVLMEKQLHCEEHKIDLTFLVDGKELSIMKAGDIASLFGNMLDNAIEYVKSLPETQRTIRLRAAKNGDFLCIHCENPFEGELAFRNGLPETSKADKENHGFGMLSIDYIAKHYGGICSVQQQEGKFVVNILIPYE